jgi:hypothetical protein
MARCAKRRTSGLASESARLKAGRASRAAGPMPARPMQALLRDPSSGSASRSTSPGTAETAIGPICPIAWAASPRTRASESCSAVINSGKHGCSIETGFAATFRKRTTFLLTCTSGLANPRVSAGRAACRSPRIRAYSSRRRCSIGSMLPSERAVAGRAAGKAPSWRTRSSAGFGCSCCVGSACVGGDAGSPSSASISGSEVTRTLPFPLSRKPIRPSNAFAMSRGGLRERRAAGSIDGMDSSRFCGKESAEQLTPIS